MKTIGHRVTFSEVPGEASLTFVISGCKNNCTGCHSPELREDIGYELGKITIGEIIDQNKLCTCVTFMGGDSDVEWLKKMVKVIHSKGKKAAIYSGDAIAHWELFSMFDYIKTGPYMEKLGGLTSPITNQCMWKKETDGSLVDITPKFWRD